MYIQVPDVGGYLGKEGDRIMFGAMWFLNVKIAISAPYADRPGELLPKGLLPMFDC